MKLQIILFYNILYRQEKLTKTNYNNLTITSKVYTFSNIAKWKDPRLELVEIPKGLIELLQNAGFTIEKILDSEPSEIAEILGITKQKCQEDFQ